jgi:methionyl-tRNA formyltransferase
MKIVFMGTPDFAVAGLEELINSKHDICAVITQPDRAKGRGKKYQKTPVKICALDNGIPVYQPENINTEDMYVFLENLNADLFVVIAYGQILKKRILDMPKYGAINVHASILPELRGAAPINWAIIEGAKFTGITTMQMDIGMDTGDMLLKRKIEISETTTYGELHDVLMEESRSILLDTIDKIESNSIKLIKQDSEMATYARKIDKNLGLIDFNKNAREVSCLIRGLDPKPGAYIIKENIKYKIFEPTVVKTDLNNKPGEIIRMDKNGLLISCKEDAICIKIIQAPGKKKMSINAYLLGNETWRGTIQ